MNRQEIEKVLKAMSTTGKIQLELMGLRDEGLYSLSQEQLESKIDELINKSEGIFDTLEVLINQYTGVNNNDFIGDGYAQMMLDLFYNGGYTPNEILKEFEEIDVVAQREWVVEYNLNLLNEFNEKINKDDDKERSKEIFNTRFKLLLNQTEVPENKKLYYTNLLLDYVNGKKKKDEVISKYRFYIYK